jgi:hypothetical protein
MAQDYRKNAWLHSFLDVVLLLICFFVMIFAATRDYSMREQNIINSVRERFSAKVDRGDIFADQGVIAIASILNSHLKDKKINDYIDVIADINKLSIIIPYKFLLKDGNPTKEAVMIVDFFVEFLFNISKKKMEILNLIDLDAIMIKKSFSDRKDVIDYSLKSLIKVEALFRGKGLSNEVSFVNKFSSIKYKNESIYDAIQINIYSD